MPHFKPFFVAGESDPKRFRGRVGTVVRRCTRTLLRVPLHDASGKTIGSLSTVFKYAAGDDEVKMHKAALAIRDDVTKKIPDKAALFKPAK